MERNGKHRHEILNAKENLATTIAQYATTNPRRTQECGSMQRRRYRSVVFTGVESRTCAISNTTTKRSSSTHRSTHRHPFDREATVSTRLGMSFTTRLPELSSSTQQSIAMNLGAHFHIRLCIEEIPPANGRIATGCIESPTIAANVKDLRAKTGNFIERLLTRHIRKAPDTHRLIDGAGENAVVLDIDAQN